VLPHARLSVLCGFAAVWFEIRLLGIDVGAIYQPRELRQ
jgi:hypothetical protein